MFLLALLFGEHGNEKISIDFFQLFFGPMNTLTSNSSPLRAHALRFQCQMCVVRLSIDAMFIKMFVNVADGWQRPGTVVNEQNVGGAGL